MQLDPAPYGQPPVDLDSIWMSDRKRFERRRNNIVYCLLLVRTVREETANLIEKTLLQISAVEGESMISFHELSEPEPFAKWSPDMEFERFMEEIQRKWKYEVLYTSVASVQTTLRKPMTDAVRGLRKWSLVGPRMREPQWSSEQNFDAMTQDLDEQTKAIYQLLEHAIEPAARILEDLKERAKKERGEVTDDLRERFETADDQGKLDIIKEVWKEATDPFSKAPLEESWQSHKLGMLRVLLMYDMTEPLLKVCPKMTTAAEELRDEFPLRR